MGNFPSLYVDLLSQDLLWVCSDLENRGFGGSEILSLLQARDSLTGCTWC